MSALDIDWSGDDVNGGSAGPVGPLPAHLAGLDDNVFPGTTGTYRGPPTAHPAKPPVTAERSRALPPIPAFQPFTDLPAWPAIKELAKRKQWVAWKYIPKPGKGKADKVPYNPATGRAASTSDLATWGAYAEARALAASRNMPGVGFVLSPDDGLTGIDLDECRDPATGELSQFAAEMVALAETYAEVSPSGRGIRMFALGKVAKATKFDPAGVEIYGDGRYLTVTGRHVEGTPDAINAAPKTVAALIARVDAVKAAAQAAKGTAPGGREGFFPAVNTLALASLGAWVTTLLPAARPSGTGYRVSSADLGRDLEEDLSITPGGIVDFGVADQGDRHDGKRSAIDLVVEHGEAVGVTDAAMWLCERLEVAPESLGWVDAGAQVGIAGQRTTITIEGGNIATAGDAAVQALRASGASVYRRSGKLVRPVSDELPAAHGRTVRVARLAEVKGPALVNMLARNVDFQRYDARKNRYVRVNPPRDLAEDILSREGDELPFPTVAGCITTPTLRADGSLLQASGYDEATRLYHCVDPGLKLPPMPEEPTRSDAEAAMALLGDLLANFPFVGPTDRAVALSALMMATLRGGMSVAPLHLIRAHTAGTGKSFLVDLASTIATGRICPVSSAGAGEEEKRLTGLLLSGAPVMSLDNVNGDLDGVFLCQAVERPLVSLRPLGTSVTFEVECRAAIFATGNNTVVKGDMIRRTLTSNLDAGLEAPEKRSFHFNPVERVLADRGAYVAAVLTISRAHRTYTASGGRTRCQPLGSFGGYSTAVREPLIWLGMDDPVASMEAARAADPERATKQELFGHWEATLGLGKLYRTAEIEEAAWGARPATLGNFLMLHFPGHGGSVNALKLGRYLARIEGDPIEGRKLEMQPDKKHGHAYRLVQAGGG